MRETAVSKPHEARKSRRKNGHGEEEGGKGKKGGGMG